MNYRKTTTAVRPRGRRRTVSEVEEIWGELQDEDETPGIMGERSLPEEEEEEVGEEVRPPDERTSLLGSGGGGVRSFQSISKSSV